MHSKRLSWYHGNASPSPSPTLSDTVPLAIRFLSQITKVAEMESYLKTVNNAVPPRDIVNSLAAKFSGSAERLGKVVVQPKQVWNWFQNRRYSNRSKLHKAPAKLAVSTTVPEDSTSHRNVTNSVHATAAPGKNPFDNTMEFEAKSVRDGAWYDVGEFLAVRNLENGDPEVQIRLSGLGIEENEWVNVRECVRQRSLPCDAVDCAAVLPGDLILCFQEGTEQALYFNAHVLDTQRRRHDMRGCRCRFLVRYDHDQSEEIVPLKKICRRPETEQRMQVLLRSRLTASDKDLNEAAQKSIRPPKLTDVNKEGASSSNLFQVKEQPVAVAVTQMKEQPIAVTVTQVKEPTVAVDVTQKKEQPVAVAVTQTKEPPVAVAVTQMKEPPVAVEGAAASIVDGSSLAIPGVPAIDATKSSGDCENPQQ